MTGDNVIYLRIQGNGENEELFKTDRKIHKLAQGGMFICNKGNVKIILNDQTFELEQNTMVVYFPYSTLEILFRSEDLDGIIMAIDLESIQPLLSKITDIDSIMHIRQDPFTCLTEDCRLRIYNYIRMYERHLELAHTYALKNERRFWQLNNIQLENIKTNLILQIFLAYTDKYDSPKNTVNRKDEIVRIFLNHLQKHYIEQHEVGFYANLQCISMRYFSFVVRERTGKTPSKWISSALANDAKHLLTDSNMSVKEISDMLKFPNQSYFGKWFKTNVGVGPVEYKKIKNFN